LTGPVVLTWTAACLISYILGSINAAYYWIRWVYGTDIRNAGSGNAGARNAGRVHGKASFMAVLIMDAALGALAVVIGIMASSMDSLLPGFCALMAIVGHVFPAQLHGKGGKGLAKATGGLIMLAVSGATASLWLAVPGSLVLLAFTHRSYIRHSRRK
jgi:glycerol-3-phosphate acyltransferase PlsY